MRDTSLVKDRALVKDRVSAPTLTLAAGPLRARVERRPLLVGGLVVLLVVGIGTLALMLGDYPLSVGDVLRALAGQGSDPMGAYFVRDVRLPRVVAAVLVGIALGASGAVLQTLSRNPLGSPDVIGLTTGAATGALVQIIVLGGDSRAVVVGALLGGLGTAVVVYTLAWRGGVSGYRLVLVGIGVGATLAAVNALLVVRASLVAAQTASQWLAGSLNAVLWPQVALLAVGLAVLLPVAAGSARDLAMLAMPDDVCVAAGVPVQRTRRRLLLVSVALMSVATAITGPVAFVALAAPHVARRLGGTAGPALATSALVGGLLVLVSDVLAQRLFAPTQLAVGAVTGALGGVYLVVLLVIQARRSRV